MATPADVNDGRSASNDTSANSNNTNNSTEGNTEVNTEVNSNVDVSGNNERKQQQKTPTPPPHDPTAEADSFKAAGNKFFKSGDYDRAVSEYNKGIFCFAR